MNRCYRWVQIDDQLWWYLDITTVDAIVRVGCIFHNEHDGEDHWTADATSGLNLTPLPKPRHLTRGGAMAAVEKHAGSSHHITPECDSEYCVVHGTKQS